MYALWTFWEKHGCIGCVYYKHYGSSIISILYSYFFYKKKLATGEGLKIQYNTKKCDISDHRNFRYCVYYMDFVLGKHSDSL